MRPLAMAPYPVLLPHTPRLLWRLRGDLDLFLFLFLCLDLARAPRAYTLTSAQIDSLALVFHLSILVSQFWTLDPALPSAFKL